MPMRIGTEMPALEGATEWFGATQAHAEAEGYVPAYYLFDAEGKLRSFAAGERGLDLLKATLDRVLAPAQQVAAT